MNLSNLMLRDSRKKLSRLLCITALSACSVFAYAQQQPVHLTGNNLPLKSVFKQLEKQTELSIDYKYNPQNEMFRLLGTKRSFSQNETFFFSHP